MWRLVLLVVIGCGSAATPTHTPSPSPTPIPIAVADPMWAPPTPDAPKPRGSLLREWDIAVVMAFNGEPLVGGRFAERFRREAGKHHPEGERMVMEMSMVARRKCEPGHIDFSACLARIVIRRNNIRWIVFGEVTDHMVTAWLISTVDARIVHTVAMANTDIDDDVIRRAWLELTSE